MEHANRLIEITPSSPYLYLAYSLVVPLALRFVNSGVEALRLNRSKETACDFWDIFRGVGNGAGDNGNCPADYWLAFVLGVFEMLAYPILMVADHYLFIGFWLTFKTVHRWFYAPNWSRGPFNRYLVMNAGILVASYLSARFAVAQ